MIDANEGDEKRNSEDGTDDAQPEAPRRSWLKRILMGLGALVVVVLAAGGGYVGCLTHSYDESVSKVYDVPVPDVQRSDDPDVIARGKHIAESIGACSAAECHGAELSGGEAIDMGPVGTLVGPNITPGGVLADYSDGELYRLMRHALRRDDRTVRFMPVHEINWLPHDDIVALISFLRTVPAVDRQRPESELGVLAKVLDRRDALHIDIARRIDHDAAPPQVPAPEPTKEYGAFVARSCTGCHGKTFSGGPIPGAPPDMPVPPNITPHESGIAHYAYEDFVTLLETGQKPDGSELDPFMPYRSLSKMNDIEKEALWRYLESLPPTPFGGR